MGSRLVVRNRACISMMAVMKWRKGVGAAASTCACATAATVGAVGLAAIVAVG